LRQVALVTLFAGLLLVAASARPLLSQDTAAYGGTSSFGISASYSPNSTHILIGDSRKRQTWTAGVEYTHLLHQNHHLRFDYEGSVSPFYLERDPTVIATVFNSNGVNIVTRQTPVRVVSVTSAPIGAIEAANGQIVPLYAEFGTQETYGAALSPLGARISALPHSAIQPSFAVDLGFVVSSQDLPVDHASRFNYTFAAGPGLQFFANHRTSMRVEYLYRHISNAGQGDQNPGIDQGVIRLTVSHHR
jgi:opacity protein-like surface antigen